MHIAWKTSNVRMFCFVVRIFSFFIFVCLINGKIHWDNTKEKYHKLPMLLKKASWTLYGGLKTWFGIGMI